MRVVRCRAWSPPRHPIRVHSSSPTIAARSVEETAAVFWNGSKIQRRFREGIKRPRAASARGFDLAAEQPLGVAMGDALRLVLGKLREPAAVGLHDGVVAEPAVVAPSVGLGTQAEGILGQERR